MLYWANTILFLVLESNPWPSRALCPLVILNNIPLVSFQGGFCLWKACICISKVVNHLDNREHYRKLGEVPTNIFVQDIKNVLSKMVNCCSIDKEIADSLLMDDTIFSSFYVLAEMHRHGNCQDKYGPLQGYCRCHTSTRSN